MFLASLVPEAAGLWDFVLAVSPRVEDRSDQDLERIIVHELVHLMLEPLREAYFAEIPVLRTMFVERWETVVERVTDTFIRLVDR